MRDIQQLQELADFLTSRRHRLNPVDVGISVQGRRRTKGLRREEVAQHAGISATWYVRLEQGRDVRASPHALERIGKALRLTPSEQAYLMRLARPDLDWRRHACFTKPSDSLLALLSGLAPHPAYIVDRYWNVVAMNDPATALLGRFRDEDVWSTNLIARLFLDPHWRTLFRDWSEVARAAAGQFRLSVASAGNDPVLKSIVSTIESQSEAFRTLWNGLEIAEPPVWRKTLVLAAGEERTFDFATLRPSGADSDYFVSIYTPAQIGSQSAS